MKDKYMKSKEIKKVIKFIFYEFDFPHAMKKQNFEHPLKSGISNNYGHAMHCTNLAQGSENEDSILVAFKDANSVQIVKFKLHARSMNEGCFGFETKIHNIEVTP